MGAKIDIHSGLKPCLTLCLRLSDITHADFIDSQESQRLKP